MSWSFVRSRCGIRIPWWNKQPPSNLPGTLTDYPAVPPICLDPKLGLHPQPPAYLPPGPFAWHYFEDSDVLHLKAGVARKKQDVNLGPGLFLTIDTATQDIIGITVIGLRDRLRRYGS